MMYAYLLSYNPIKIYPPALHEEIDRISTIVNWVAPYAGCVIIVSPLSAADLSLILRSETELEGNRYLIADLDTDRAGWIPRRLWKLIRDAMS